MRYMVGTTVELGTEADSLEEAQDILYKMLKSMGLDVGDLNGFEVPEDDEEDDKEVEEYNAYNYYNLCKLYFNKFLLCYEKCNNINVKENKNLNLALENIDKAIELKPDIALYYDTRSEILNIIGYSNESLKDSFMASTLKDK